MRSADCLGAVKIFLTGYSPYPPLKKDARLPHIRQRVANQISKTALGAENYIDWDYIEDIEDCLRLLKRDGYMIVALEQTTRARELTTFQSDKDIALIVGNEVDGLDDSVLDSIDSHLKIPMEGQKESLNVTVAAAIALHWLRNQSNSGQT